MGEGGAWDRPRSAFQLLGATFGLYRRFPLLFLVLAAVVIVPGEAIVFAILESRPFDGFGTGIVVNFADLGLITPLVSALHIHAVREIRTGGEPHLAPVARQGLRALPLVALVSVVSWLGIFVGFLALIVPGVILMLRWAVVAQAAATERQGLGATLRRSADLTEGHYGHVFAIVLAVLLIVEGPALLLGLAFESDPNDLAQFLAGTAIAVPTASFAALATALLYYDLRVRAGARPVPQPVPAGPPAEDHSAEDHLLDPRSYSPGERPSGWYVDPAAPNRMRYWAGGETQRWEGRTRTPAKIRREWEGEEDRRD